MRHLEGYAAGREQLGRILDRHAQAQPGEVAETKGEAAMTHLVLTAPVPASS
jgi:hypothetical protein